MWDVEEIDQQFCLFVVQCGTYQIIENILNRTLSVVVVHVIIIPVLVFWDYLSSLTYYGDSELLDNVEIWVGALEKHCVLLYCTQIAIP